MDKYFQEDGMLQFPIFHLIGGTQTLRNEFIEKLQKELDSCYLDVGFVRNSLPQRFELFSLVRRFDLVIVDGTVAFALHKIHLDSSNHVGVDDLVWGEAEKGSMDTLIEAMLAKLEHIARQVPVWACILIGGRSSRMGQPKHLLKRGEESWLEHTVRLVGPHVEGLVVSGRGELPKTLDDTQRIPDIPGVAGPLTGVLSAMRWQPCVSWLVIACDMPFISDDALNWLLSGRRPGCWGRLPRLADAEFCEPLLAWYDGRGAHLLEEQLLSGNLRIGKIASHLKIDNPIIPETLCSAWQNVNTPEQLQDTFQSTQLS
ncbi:MAG: molybdopterin-guanine dinucleotide biosynthesis protein A [Desulforhopalus sp.]|jgi:molybdopterin-guanine dinucleotide biosynthesis protein A